MPLMKTLLVPVDFSDPQGRLLAAAESEAKLRGAGLVLLHVIEPAAEVAGLETDPEMMRMRVGVDLAEEERIESARLKEICAAVAGRGISCQPVVKFGLPADEIVSEAKARSADLVVMGSHGHGALYHLFTGSVATGVLKQIDCPVLVIPLRSKK